MNAEDTKRFANALKKKTIYQLRYLRKQYRMHASEFSKYQLIRAEITARKRAQDTGF